nr:MAG TPA: hypothetical protein [Caudoviricetes sp.]
MYSHHHGAACDKRCTPLHLKPELYSLFKELNRFHFQVNSLADSPVTVP